MIYYKFDYDPISIVNNGYEIRARYHYLNNSSKNHVLLKNAGDLVGKRLLLKGHKVFCKEASYDCDMQGDYSLTLTLVGENQPKQIKTFETYHGEVKFYA